MFFSSSSYLPFLFLAYTTLSLSSIFSGHGQTISDYPGQAQGVSGNFAFGTGANYTYTEGAPNVNNEGIPVKTDTVGLLSGYAFNITPSQSYYGKAFIQYSHPSKFTAPFLDTFYSSEMLPAE